MKKIFLIIGTVSLICVISTSILIDHTNNILTFGAKIQKNASDEIKNVQEKINYNENKNSINNLPYYHDTVQKKKTFTYSCPSPSPNGNNIFLLTENN